jgi:hypothetical protein
MLSVQFKKIHLEIREFQGTNHVQSSLVLELSVNVLLSLISIASFRNIHIAIVPHSSPRKDTVVFKANATPNA